MKIIIHRIDTRVWWTSSSSTRDKKVFWKSDYSISLSKRKEKGQKKFFRDKKKFSFYFICKYIWKIFCFKITFSTFDVVTLDLTLAGTWEEAILLIINHLLIQFFLHIFLILHSQNFSSYFQRAVDIIFDPWLIFFYKKKINQLVRC